MSTCVHVCAHVCVHMYKEGGKSSVCKFNLVHLSHYLPDYDAIHSLMSEHTQLGKEKSPLFTLGQCSLTS